MKKLIILGVMFMMCDRYITYKIGKARHYAHMRKSEQVHLCVKNSGVGSLQKVS